MADCAALLKAVEAARADWNTKHAASCKGLPDNQHSSSCSNAYQYYLARLAEWSKDCAPKT